MVYIKRDKNSFFNEISRLLTLFHIFKKNELVNYKVTHKE